MVVTAQAVSLIAASGVGVVLAVVLFIREQIGGSVVHRKTDGNKIFSRQTRLPAAMAILQRDGGQAVIFELQGSLFFGTTDKLYSALESELKTRRYVILAERGGFLLFSHIPPRLPSGQDVQRYFDEVGLVRAKSQAKIFAELDNALEWVEERILAEAEFTRSEEQPLSRKQFDALAEEHKRMAINLLEGLARVLAIRLRYANAELHVLQT